MQHDIILETLHDSCLLTMWACRSFVDCLLRQMNTDDKFEKVVIAEVVMENDYMSRGHFYTGFVKELKLLTSIQSLPIGTKVYVCLPTQQTDIQ